MLGSLLLGASKVDPVRFTDFLNKNAAQGWRVVTMEFAPLSADLFLRITVSAALVVAVIVIITLVVREYLSEKRLKDQGFIDG